MKKILILVLVIAIIIVFVSFFLFLNKQKSTPVKEPIDFTPSSQEEINSQNEEVVEITLSEDGFSPNAINISAGTTVRWINNSGKEATVDSDPHPIHTSAQELNLGMFDDNQTLELQFNKPGKYNYHNHFNPEDNGEIIVE